MVNNSTVELSFQGGTETIGGNIVILKVTVNDKYFQYLFDCGVSVDSYRPFMVLKSEPQSMNEFIRRGLIPSFELNFKACFLSHAHEDHTIALNALVNSAKRLDAIWATKTTSRLIAKKMKFIEKPLHSDPFAKEDYYEDTEAKDLGLDVKIALFPVDHDIPGSCSIIAMVENRLIVYSGDFRDHGPLSEVLERQFWDYVKILKAKNNFESTIFITEGTNYGLPFDFTSQSDFEDRVLKILNQYHDKLVSIIIDEDEFWDIFSILKLMRLNNIKRKVVICKSVAGKLKKMKDSLLEDYRRAVHPDGLKAFEEMLDLARYQILGIGEETELDLIRTIATNPEYLLFLTKTEAFTTLDRICVLSNKSGGCCILGFSGSDSGPESTISTFAEAIAQIGYCVEKTRTLARGHVSPHRLAQITQVIDPDKVFIIHSLTPDGLKSFLSSHTTCEVIAPTKGTSYKL